MMTSSIQTLWPFHQLVLLEFSLFSIKTYRKEKLLQFLNALINYLKIWPEYIIWEGLLTKVIKRSNFSILPVVSIVLYCLFIVRPLFQLWYSIRGTRWKNGKIWCQTINYSLLASYTWKQNWKITSLTDFMAFLAKALFRWNESLKNADVSILSHFLAIFVGFFLYMEKFYQKLSTGHISDQLDHPSRNYRGGGGGQNLPPPAIPIYKKPRLFRVN